eukprot:12-Alexandrium_andersonii.AAC.1
MFERESERKRAAGTVETLQEIWLECFQHKRMRDGQGLSDEQVWELLINEVHDQTHGRWWREWMADEWAKRL